MPPPERLRPARVRSLQPNRGIRGTNRVSHALGAESMKTYRIVVPLSTHFRVATCAEVNCPNYLYGWKTTCDLNTDLGQAQIDWIKTSSGRRFTSYREESGLVVFTFEAGQDCFEQHQLRLDKPEIYAVSDGDWRGNPRGTDVFKHANADDWVDDFANHQQKIADRIYRG